MGGLGLTAILVLEARPAEMALLAACGSAPALVFGLVAGVWVDRQRRRPVLVAADLGRMLSLGSVPLAWFLFRLHIEHLYAVAFVNGALGIFFSVAHPSYLPGLVGREHIFEANSKLSAASAVVESGSFTVGGWIAQLASALVAVTTQAGVFLASGLLLLSIRHREPLPPTAADRRPLRAELTDGFRALFGQPILRALALSNALIGFGSGAVGGMITLFAIREVGFAPGPIGTIYAVGGISSFVGALYAQRVARRLGLGRSIAIGFLISGAVTFLIPLAHGPLWIAAVFFLIPQIVGDGAWTVHDIGELSLRQSLTPERVRGRVNSAIAVAERAAEVLGALAAGLVAETAGLRAALALGAAVYVTAGAVLVFSRVWSVWEVPPEDE